MYIIQVTVKAGIKACKVSNGFYHGGIMQANEIYKSLEEKNISARMLASALGVTNQSVSEVIRNGRGSKRITEAIAKVIQKDLVEVFPHYKKTDCRDKKIAELKEMLGVG
ncbi:helix-turn-helix domain-containing protein [Neisseria meningitidis]|uniref:helix-turn-helix domain-containing protein n=2 Tax=Neisseria meningitidis TaxID=487 RepID=UPI001E45874E|nr:helix-turn-helix transcriptional regulator [Neisseria meningitidis]